MRLLLTGATGFVAPHVARHARSADPDAIIAGAAPEPPTGNEFDEALGLDLTSSESVSAAFCEFQPTHVVHLGGVSDYQSAEVDYLTAWDTNTLGTVRCARALQEVTRDGVFVFVSSAQVYGEPTGRPVALTEAALTAPRSEYARTKMAAELAITGMARRGLKIVCFRPFNHTGPGQSEKFVVPRFAGQLARIELGMQAPIIKVGNLEARRDFLDVRDVADAYVAALGASDTVFGQTMNLATGRAESIQWILNYLLGLSSSEISVETDPALWRPVDQSVLLGDASRARELLAWCPKFSLETTLQDVLDECRREQACAR